MSKKTTFNQKWLEEDEFKLWLAPTKDASIARCKLCKKDIELSNMGRQALLSLCSGKKHKDADVKVKVFFQPRKQKEKDQSKFSQLESEKTDTDKEPCSSKTQASIELVVKNSESSKAEILWTLESISAGYSNNSCTDIAGLFQQMFPDSHITKSVQLGPTKLKYLTNFGIAPHFKSILLENIKESPCFVLSYDESLNPMTQSCEMDLLVRFFDETEESVKTRYLDSQFLGHGTSIDLKKNLDKSVQDLNPNKLIQVGMDGPNVNLKLLKLMQTERSENEQHQLIDIGSCGLHTIHNAFKTVAESTGWGMKSVLKGAYQIFHDSPARREDFLTVIGTDQFPLSFCATRFV